MKIYKIGHRKKPKNFSRKGKICSCSCSVYCGELLNETIEVKYEVEPNEVRSSYIPKLKKNQWATYEYWGTFKKIIELPKTFLLLDYDDYTVKIGSFSRDNIEMPAVFEISISNIDKYLKVKKMEDRRNKLNKIKNT